MLFFYRHHGEAVTPAQGQKLLQFGHRLHFRQAHETGKAGLPGHVHHEPSGMIGGGFRIEVIALRIPGGCVWVRCPADFHDPGDAGLGAIGMVKEPQFAYFHGLHEIAGLVVAHPIPGLGLQGAFFQITERKDVRLGFHQPVIHGLGGDENGNVVVNCLEPVAGQGQTLLTV